MVSSELRPTKNHIDYRLLYEEKQEHSSKIWTEDEVPLESYKPMH